ncbi:hypothetical protein C7S16_5890 [Burkholderia thailandensis]|uniref:Uncharacterized protein n=1 Tax=Burkholderia thailandensis TaxID=57975 RepID=A0AAW9CR86_BURTH|nr:hypothetical protein [Burkholderia thailandensis]MDW9252862.1 hypothetical protein [Burkholderia thailandensis]
MKKGGGHVRGHARDEPRAPFRVAMRESDADAQWAMRNGHWHLSARHPRRRGAAALASSHRARSAPPLNRSERPPPRPIDFRNIRRKYGCPL